FHGAYLDRNRGSAENWSGENAAQWTGSDNLAQLSTTGGETTWITTTLQEPLAIYSVSPDRFALLVVNERTPKNLLQIRSHSYKIIGLKVPSNHILTKRDGGGYQFPHALF